MFFEKVVVMRTLCVDLGTTSGWAILDDKIVSASGIIQCSPKKGEGKGFRYMKFVSGIGAVHIQYPFERIVFEDVKAHKGADAAHVYGGLLAHLQAWADFRSIPYIGIGVGTIKKHATGKGNAKKDAMIESAISRGHRPVDDNEADAIAIAYCSRDTL